MENNQLHGILCPCCRGPLANMELPVFAFECGTVLDSSKEISQGALMQGSNCLRIVKLLEKEERLREAAERAECASAVNMVPVGVCRSLVRFDRNRLMEAIEYRARQE